MTDPSPGPDSRRATALLAFAALGVVYGDIGTSPLYAMRECFLGEHAVGLTPENVFGILSLILWSLVIVVTLKYHLYVLHMDNKGEGGILALMALVLPSAKAGRHWEREMIVTLGLFGAALLYGDGIITPAISVLSAVEGLEEISHGFNPYVVPLTIVILAGLFFFQRRGTAGVSKVFSPVIAIWFLCLAALGARWIWERPDVLQAIDPRYALGFILTYKASALGALAAVFLVVTGGEALYADLGHFGSRAIDLAWFSLVLPCLTIHYFGQGALLLVKGDAVIGNPFYGMVPHWALYPMILLATAATIIASQAVISGAFSLTRQAVQFGYYPRVEIIHTSSNQVGQIYIPAVNWGLMLATISLVKIFGSSSNLSGAYGVAIATTMLITTVLAYVASRRVWGWPVWKALIVSGLFFTADLSFFGANLMKIFQGGLVPLVIGLAVFVTMSTWHRGRGILAERIRAMSMPLDKVLHRIASEKPARVKGTAIFMTGNPDGTPLPLQMNLEHNKVVHERVVLLNIVTDEGSSHVPPEERVQVVELKEGFYRIRARYGFMDSPSIREILEWACTKGFTYNRADTTFFLGRESVYATDLPGMAMWREHLFAVMARNATRATDYFDVPRDRVLEFGTQIAI